MEIGSIRGTEVVALSVNTAPAQEHDHIAEVSRYYSTVRVLQSDAMPLPYIGQVTVSGEIGSDECGGLRARLPALPEALTSARRAPKGA
jgi:hypothetical protein